jgi:hypothetical protein
MFGFVASPCTRCTGKSLPAWRGSFCGLARCLGREYGHAARLLVNRDAAFLSLLGLCLDPRPPAWRKTTCCNPFAEPFLLADDHPAVVHAAAVSVCGLAAKLDDDADDEGPVRRRGAQLLGALTAPVTDRAIARLNTSHFPTAAVMDCLHSQSRIENSSPHQAAQPTSQAFRQIFAHLARLLPTPTSADLLGQLGAAHGSLVYWRDAWDDRQRDAQKHRFNPYQILPESEIRHHVRQAWQSFSASLKAIPFQRHPDLFPSLLASTGNRHRDFFGSDLAEPKRRKKSKSLGRKGSCWDSCDCCYCGDCSCPRGGRGKGGCADACCDCGPGDSGCCGCDGCDCGP